MNSEPRTPSPTDEDLAQMLAGDVAEAQTLNELDGLRHRLSEAEDRALRFQAETDNVRKRMRKEMDDERKYAALGLIRDLLPAIDNFQRALAALPPDADPNVVNGIRMVTQQLLTTFQQHHCVSIEGVGEPFDPAIHEAVEQVASATVPKGSVVAVRQPGYKLHDRVVRPAFVAVSSGN